MAASYISVPRDLTKVKSKVMFNLTKRQLVCFSVAALFGVPSFFLIKQIASTSTAAMGMMVIMMPFFFLAMYEKNGQHLEVMLKHLIEAVFIRPKERPYKTNNNYAALASTLQFVGRFARTNANKIGMAKFIAANNEELAIENNRLFAKDAVWQDMIIGMSEGKNKEEQENRNYYKEYEITDVNILSAVPIQSIRPNCHVKIYRVKGFNISSEFPAECNVANRVLRNDREKTVVGIGLDFNAPLWMGNGEKINMEYNLYILHYQAETSMLYIYSQIHSEAMYEEIATSFCAEIDPIPKYEIYKVLGDLKDFEIFNSGMQSKQAQSGESYRIMAGSDVSDAIDKASGRMYSAGHAFCKATDKNEGEITIGYSSASKVWSSSYKDLKDYVAWCDSLGKKISNKALKVNA